MGNIVGNNDISFLIESLQELHQTQDTLHVCQLTLSAFNYCVARSPFPFTPISVLLILLHCISNAFLSTIHNFSAVICLKVEKTKFADCKFHTLILSVMCLLPHFVILSQRIPMTIFFIT